jgi:CDP-paratose 2-epimerase
VDDAVALYLAAAVEIDRVAGQPFNIGGGMENSLSILELLSLLESSTGVRLRWNSIAQRKSDQRVFVADSSKLRALLDWQPRVGKAEGVSRMLRWIEDLRNAPTRETIP